jgi:hypothetical protein
MWPGVSSPGHWLSILQQTVRKTNAKLDKAVVAYALSGVAINDALISCWTSKYTHNFSSAVTYVREVMDKQLGVLFIGTPAHPEYPSAHSALSGAGAAVIEELFGNVGTITDQTYDYLGFAPRTYPSFHAIAVEAGLSRV